MIFERVTVANTKRSTGMPMQMSPPVRLSTYMNVPKRLVGRLVGKGGATIRMIQQTSGATVNLPKPTPPDAAAAAGGDDKKPEEEMERVEIVGDFPATTVFNTVALVSFPLSIIFQSSLKEIHLIVIHVFLNSSVELP